MRSVKSSDRHQSYACDRLNKRFLAAVYIRKSGSVLFAPTVARQLFNHPNRSSPAFERILQQQPVSLSNSTKILPSTMSSFTKCAVLAIFMFLLHFNDAQGRSAITASEKMTEQTESIKQRCPTSRIVYGRVLFTETGCPDDTFRASFDFIVSRSPGCDDITPGGPGFMGREPCERLSIALRRAGETTQCLDNNAGNCDNAENKVQCVENVLTKLLTLSVEESKTGEYCRFRLEELKPGEYHRDFIVDSARLSAY